MSAQKDKIQKDILEYLDLKQKDQLVNILLDFSKSELESNRKDYEEQLDKLSKLDQINENIICKNCFTKSFKGIRYLCSYCDKNICQQCENQRQHDKDHILIRLNEPIDTSDIYKYSSEFKLKQKEFIYFYSNKENKLKIKNIILNFGTKQWEENFFLAPICYGKNFLRGKKVECGKEIKCNESWNVEIELPIEKCGNFVSRWRMFTNKGIPFGKLWELNVTIHKINEENESD